MKIKTARDKCRTAAIKAQFRAQKLKERVNLRPPTKSTISEIITVENIDGREIETRHTTEGSTGTDRANLL